MFRYVGLFILISVIGVAQQNIKISSKQSSTNSSETITEVRGYRFHVNNLDFPIGNNGTIADVNLPIYYYGGKYDGYNILFSGGFMMTGKANGQRWANGQASSSLIENFKPGVVNSDPNDPKNIIYVIKADDPPFSSSWIKYKDAVSQGADFYDGDLDGVYNPVDINNNGIWDRNEDRPDYLGDESAWCVYNDADTARERFRNEVPQKIEIQQTAFGYAGYGAISNVIYFRYRIINRNTAASVMDSVYFTTWSDPDIGNHSDDIVGCDTLLNAGYCYSDTSDNVFGPNPPALLVDLVQGPPSYIPGITFTDNNGNAEYDEDTDTPLDTAYFYQGALRGLKILKGARNQPMTSFANYMASDPVLGDPDTCSHLFNYATGKMRNGIVPNPCTWYMGEVVGGVDCSMVNPYFWYSGDPVAKVGWLHKVHSDQRQMVSSGPFKLKLNEPIDIIVAYVAGRGNTPLASVTKVKQNDIAAQEYLNNNFPYTDVKDDKVNTIKDFSLFQNYPNPFNPSTIIKYSLPAAGTIRLVLYNSLGQEIKELASGYKPAGTYELNFSAGNLSSGVYFYRMTASSLDGSRTFSQALKLTIVK